MFNIALEENYLITCENSSIGVQEKYYDSQYWYKIDKYGGEASAEELSSLLLQCSTLNSEEYVTYEEGIVNGKVGCRSKNFLHSDEDLITFKQAHESVLGKSFGRLLLGKTYPDKIKYCLWFFQTYFDLDVSSYLAKTFYLDMLIRNEDRNFGNLAIIYNSSFDTYKTAPIFDNGFSMLVGNEPYKQIGSIADRLKSVPGKPFVGNLEVQARYFEAPFKIDYEKFDLLIAEKENSLQKDVIKYQVEKYKDIFRLYNSYDKIENIQEEVSLE